MTVVESLRDILLGLGLLDSSITALTVARVIALAVAVLLSIAGYAVARRLLLGRSIRAIEAGRGLLASVLLQRRVLHRLCILAPLVIMHASIPHVLAGHGEVILTARRVIGLLLALTGTLVVDAALNAALDYHETSGHAQKASVRSVVQASKIVVYLLVGVMVFSFLLEVPLLAMLTAFGALLAVSGFVLHDPILGFVGSLQLAANDMVAIGDQIEMPEYHAEGHVVEINMTTVKVQNFDKSITTIPTYGLIREPVKNWRAMEESGGRQIRRAVFIDISTIKFCTEEMLTAFMKLGHTAEYIDRKRMETAADGKAGADSGHGPPNEAGITNVDVFQAYVTGYLRSHPGINQRMRALVRQLDPTPHGLPVEIWAFTKATDFDNHEAVQSEILSHVLTIAPEFDLRIFQRCREAT